MSHKIAIVTGATGGLGKEFVKILADEDIDEIWCIARNVNKLNALKTKFGDKIITISADLSDTDSIRVIDEKLKEKDILVKYLINNAGSGRMDLSQNFTDKEIADHIAVHCTVPALLCNHCLSYMKSGSHIINMASQAAFQPLPYLNLYASGKSFIRSYTRALNSEIKSRGITATAACPGWIKTELLDFIRNGKDVVFPFLAMPEDVADKIISDAKKGRDMSVYGTYIKWMHLLTKVSTQKTAMKTWTKSISKYI